MLSYWTEVYSCILQNIQYIVKSSALNSVLIVSNAYYNVLNNNYGTNNILFPAYNKKRKGLTER
jgi:hypothetical protein